MAVQAKSTAKSKAQAQRKTARPKPWNGETPLPTPLVLIKARRQPDVVDVPAHKVIFVEGQGGPDPAMGDAAGAQRFQDAIQGLYGVAYTLKFGWKMSGAQDFKVGPLESEWWVDDPARVMPEVPPALWRWRLQIAVPGKTTAEDVARAIIDVTTKKNGKLAGSTAPQAVALRTEPAQRCGRVLHVGPYSAERESIERINALLAREGLTRTRRHGEIYLSDPRRTAPEKLKTVLLAPLAG